MARSSCRARSNKLAYTSRVIDGDECPSTRETYTTSDPSLIHSDAAVCLRSWNLGSGSASPAASRITCHARTVFR